MQNKFVPCFEQTSHIDRMPSPEAAAKSSWHSSFTVNMNRHGRRIFTDTAAAVFLQGDSWIFHLTLARLPPELGDQFIRHGQA